MITLTAKITKVIAKWVYRTKETVDVVKSAGPCEHIADDTYLATRARIEQPLSSDKTKR